MIAISRGYEDGCVHILDSKNIQVCIHHFHPSIIECNSDGKYSPKLGASPTIYLTTFAMDNEQFKEDSRYNRITGYAEDIKHVSSCEIQNNNNLHDKILVLGTTERDIHNNKHHFEIIKAKESKK